MPATILTVTSEDISSRLDRFLKRQHPNMIQSFIEKALRNKQITVNGKKAKSSYRVEANDKIEIYFTYVENEQSPIKKTIAPWTKKDEELLSSWILFEDDNILVINKPAGLAVQGGTKITNCLDDMLFSRGFENGCTYRLVHRLDKETSGVLLISKNLLWARHLTLAFKNRSIRKVYYALIVGIPPHKKGRITHSLKKGVGNYKEKMLIDEAGLSAVTEYEVLKTSPNKEISLIALYPESGRTHQLRVHMQSLDCPILGDGKYGGSHATQYSRQLHLHAQKITFPLLSGDLMSYQASQPQSWETLLSAH